MQDDKYLSKPMLRSLAAIVLLSVFLYFGRTLLIPMCYGLFIAIVMYPLCSWLERHGFPKSIAVTVSLLVVIVLAALLVWLLILQVNAFRNDMPALRAKLSPSLDDLTNWTSRNLGITLSSQENWMKQLTAKMQGNTGALLISSLSSVTMGLFMLFIIPVFTALFLFNRNDFILFLEKIAGDRYTGRLHSILNKTLFTYIHFIKGMIFVYIIVGALNSIGLLALGIKHAVLFGFLTAIMTIIPYVGIFISALLPITVAWITKDSIWYPLGVIAVFVFVQYLEANVIFPRVVASQLNVSTWATLVAIIAGGILWGVSGMILFIPFVAIIKKVTDHIPEWEPLNILLRRNDL